MFSFKGRAGRLNWWGVVIVVSIGQAYLEYVVRSAVQEENWSASLKSSVSLVASLLFFFLLWVTLATTTGRWHDRDKSGWWSLLFLTPALAFFAVLFLSSITGRDPSTSAFGGAALISTLLLLWPLVELGFLPGTNGPNRFGDPVTPVRKQKKLSRELVGLKRELNRDLLTALKSAYPTVDPERFFSDIDMKLALQPILSSVNLMLGRPETERFSALSLEGLLVGTRRLRESGTFMQISNLKRKQKLDHSILQVGGVLVDLEDGVVEYTEQHRRLLEEADRLLVGLNRAAS